MLFLSLTPPTSSSAKETLEIGVDVAWCGVWPGTVTDSGREAACVDKAEKHWAYLSVRGLGDQSKPSA